MDGDSLVGVDALRSGRLENPSILALNDKMDGETDLYGDSLSGSVIGIMRKEEVESYFSFIDKVWLPLGIKRLEKIVFDGIAVVLGYYPKTYVSEQDYNKLFEDNEAVRLASETLLMSIRLVFLMAIILIFLRTVGLIQAALLGRRIN